MIKHWPVRFKKKKKSHWPLESEDHFTWSTRTAHQHQDTTWPALSSSTSKQAANKINIQPRQKANNFKLKRESRTENKGEREREHTSPRRLASLALVQAWGIELRSRRETLRLELGSKREAWDSQTSLGINRSASTRAESASTGADKGPYHLWSNPLGTFFFSFLIDNVGNLSKEKPFGLVSRQ